MGRGERVIEVCGGCAFSWSFGWEAVTIGKPVVSAGISSEPELRDYWQGVVNRVP